MSRAVSTGMKEHAITDEGGGLNFCFGWDVLLRI